MNDKLYAPFVDRMPADAGQALIETDSGATILV